jgi:periplasmic divalent cation tolerance protein
MTEFIQVSTTVDSEARARRIANLLLERRLSSCVQVAGPIRSHYWWNRMIQHATEWLCIIKARRTDYREIEAAIKRIHPYEIPEILAFPILTGGSDYLRWMRKETTRKTGAKSRRRKSP